jgi:hypothetical protein
MIDLLGKTGKFPSESGNFGHESHPFRHQKWAVFGGSWLLGTNWGQFPP